MFFLSQTWVKILVQLIPVSESMLVFYAENFDGEKTTKVTYALGMYCKTHSIANRSCLYYQDFCIEDRSITDSILLSTLGQTCTHTGEPVTSVT